LRLVVDRLLSRVRPEDQDVFARPRSSTSGCMYSTLHSALDTSSLSRNLFLGMGGVNCSLRSRLPAVAEREARGQDDAIKYRGSENTYIKIEMTTNTTSAANAILASAFRRAFIII
jgi:hypothetical protein